jgi:hypothetical protein
MFQTWHPCFPYSTKGEDRNIKSWGDHVYRGAGKAKAEIWFSVEKWWSSPTSRTDASRPRRIEISLLLPLWPPESVAQYFGGLCPHGHFSRGGFIGLLASCNLFLFWKEDSASSYIQFGWLSLEGHTLPWTQECNRFQNPVSGKRFCSQESSRDWLMLIGWRLWPVKISQWETNSCMGR